MVISMGPDLPLGTSTLPAEDRGRSTVHTQRQAGVTHWLCIVGPLSSFRGRWSSRCHVYQSWRGSSCSTGFGLASTAGLTNCLWIARKRDPRRTHTHPHTPQHAHTNNISINIHALPYTDAETSITYTRIHNHTVHFHLTQKLTHRHSTAPSQIHTKASIPHADALKYILFTPGDKCLSTAFSQTWPTLPSARCNYVMD